MGSGFAVMRGCVWCRPNQRACERCAPFWAGCIIYVLILIFAACSGPLRTGDQRWPIVCAGPNPTGEWIQAVAQDGDFRTRAFVKLPPFGDKRCEFWPWQHHKGRIGYVIYPDTNWMRWQEIGR